MWAGQPVGHRGKGIYQGGPLDALHDVKVNDVDSAEVDDSFKDGLVGGEVSKLEVWGHVLEELEGGHRVHGRRVVVGSTGCGEVFVV